MELTLLRRLVGQLSEELRGSRCEQAYALPPYHLALAIGSRSGPRLWFSADPDEPHLYLRPGTHPTPSRPPAFAMALRKRARGRRVERLTLLGDDRVVELIWSGGGARLIFELVPRRATALVLDDEARVVAAWNPRRGRPGPGTRYEPPARTSRTSPAALTEEGWLELEYAGAAGDLPRALLRTVAGVTQMVAREVEHRVAGGTPLRQAIEAEVDRALTAPSEPRVYAPLPPETLRRLPAGRGFELSPFRLESRQGDSVRAFDSLTAAAAFFYPLRARLRLLDRARAQIAQAASRQRRRLQRADRRLRAGLEQAQDSERLQQLGDLLLANPTLRMDRASVQVADLYREGEDATIEIDATIDLAANAERYYRRAQRARRKLAQDTARLEHVTRDLAELDAILDRAAAMDDVATLRRLLDEARALGMELDPHALREPEAEGAPSFDSLAPEVGPALPGILRVCTPDGAEILVGRSATANDRLTHEIAGRRDWWLHALGPGSHVVLRNPERLEQPRPEQLVAAARLAAWFSRARGSAKVEVHWTTTSRVRRPRGGKPGQVLIERHRSMVVEPAPPTEIGRETDDSR